MGLRSRTLACAATRARQTQCLQHPSGLYRSHGRLVGDSRSNASQPQFARNRHCLNCAASAGLPLANRTALKVRFRGTSRSVKRCLCRRPISDMHGKLGTSGSTRRERKLLPIHGTEHLVRVYYRLVASENGPRKKAPAKRQGRLRNRA